MDKKNITYVIDNSKEEYISNARDYNMDCSICGETNIEYKDVYEQLQAARKESKKNIKVICRYCKNNINL